MNMQRIVKTGIVLVITTIASYVGAALDHGKEFSLISIVFGILGIPLGLWVVRKIDDFINV